MTTDSFWHAFDQTAKNFWHMLLQPTDGSLPIRVRGHWVVPTFMLLLTVGIIIGAIWLSLLVNGTSWREVRRLLWYVALAAVPHFAWRALKWRKEVVTVTTKSFTVNKGIIWTTDWSISITKVSNVEFRETPMGQLLGYGTLTVETAAQQHGHETIAYLPRQFYPVIKNLVQTQ